MKIDQIAAKIEKQWNKFNTRCKTDNKLFILDRKYRRHLLINGRDGVYLAAFLRQMTSDDAFLARMWKEPFKQLMHYS